MGVEKVVLYLGLAFLFVIAINVSAVHKEDMEHIKQGHCKTTALGSENKQWAICK